MLTKTLQSISELQFINNTNKISANPLDRLPDNVRNDILSPSNISSHDKLFFDVHAHSFTLNNIPGDYSKLLNWFTKVLGKTFRKWISGLLQLPFTKNRSKEVMDTLIDNYDSYFMDNNISPHLFVVNLMMDMERSIGGGIKSNFDKQLKELSNIMKLSYTPGSIGASGRVYNYNEVVLPFLAIDPHNPDACRQFISAFSPGLNLTSNPAFNADQLFYGIKLYPSLGYLPYDPVLMSIFKVCEAKNIPITTHAGGVRTRANHFKFELGDYSKPKGSQYVTRDVKSKKEFKNVFLYPMHWEKVLKEYPNLKINFAHMGSSTEWKDYINGDRTISNSIVQSLQMIKKYPNVYCDISYSLHDENNQEMILQLMKNDDYKSKILFGSDYFLVDLEHGSIETFVKSIRKKFKSNRNLWHMLTVKNPFNYLFS